MKLNKSFKNIPSKFHQTPNTQSVAWLSICIKRKIEIVFVSYCNIDKNSFNAKRMVAFGFIVVYFPDPGYQCMSLAGYRQF